MGRLDAWGPRLLLRGAALVAALAHAGCAMAFTPPTVQVAEVRLAALSFTGGTLRVTLDVDNPNRYALESQDFRYTVDFAQEGSDGDGWINLARGAVAETVRVPAGESARVEVDVPFDIASVGAAVGRLLRQGELEYRFSGELRAGTPLGSRRIPFDQRGVFRP